MAASPNQRGIVMKEFAKLMLLAPLAGAASFLIVGHPGEVRAQTVFCPSSVLSQSGINSSGGTCTNEQTAGSNSTGSFSGAILAGQALSELSQSTTQETTRQTATSVSERREKEVERCAEGFSRVDGTCQRNPPPVAEAAPAVSLKPLPSEKPAPKKAKKAKIAAIPREEAPAPAHRAPPQAMVCKDGPCAPPPVPIEPAVRFGGWTQVYGDYEKRDATAPGGIVCCVAGGILGPIPLELTAKSRTGSVGFQAGADLTARGILFANDGIIAGGFGGYMSSDLTLNTAALSGDLTNLKNEFAHLNANLAGPTAGLYATYFSGPFSADVLLNVFLPHLNVNFIDSLAFCACFGAPTFGKVPFVGAGSTDLIDATIAGNLNYRFALYPSFWIEPTVGAQYTNLSYGSGAAGLGLDDGDLVMVQGGARVGTTTLINNRILMTTTLTGLAYDNVQISGGFIPGAAFAGNNILRQADEGQVRGRGVLALNADFGQGLTSFVQGEVRGGKGLFGAGGKAGVRYQW